MPRETSMENITSHIAALGRKIYSLRMARQMSQEQLAAVLRISPAAVSKWERNLSNPSIEMLWVLADLFECSIDELVGRTLIPLKEVGIYNAKKLRLIAVGEDLLKCSEVSSPLCHEFLYGAVKPGGFSASGRIPICRRF